MLLRYENPRESLANKLKLIYSPRFAKETRLRWGETGELGYNESWQLVDLYTYKDLRITGFPDHVPTSSSPKCTDPENYVANALGLVPFITYFRTWRVIDNSNLHWQHRTQTIFFFFFPLETKVISKLCSVLCKKF